jgi:hypothetical protein
VDNSHRQSSAVDNAHATDRSDAGGNKVGTVLKTVFPA